MTGDTRERMPGDGLVRGIGRWSLVALMVNVTIGAGIFGLPSRLFAMAGTYSLMAFVACAIVIALAALCFAEMSTRFTSTGGAYLYARKTFGPLVGFEMGWLSWLARLTGFASICNLFLIYLAYFWPAANQGATRTLLIALLIGTFTSIQLIGVRESAYVSNVFTVAKLIPLFIFIGVGLFFIRAENFTFTEAPRYRDFSGATMLLVFAFSFEGGLFPGGETQDPKRNFPFALLASTTVVAIVYLLVQLVCIGTLPGLATSSRPLTDAATLFLGPSGAVMISVGALISMAGTLHVNILGTSRILFAISEQGQLPAAIASVHPRFRTPHVAILISAVTVLGISVFYSFIAAVTISAMIRLSIYIITCAGVIALRFRGPPDESGFVVPGGIVIPVIVIILAIWLLTNSTGREVRDASIAAAMGLVVYAAFIRQIDRGRARVTEGARPQ
ncbi:MAG TPA: amino acid permease [Gemmatimonadaceae bacterium]|nr:amino acid permease [Gemmatimonadaceae bacterium]